mgnify:FL=1
MNSFLDVTSKKNSRVKTHQIYRDPLPLPVRIKEIYRLLKEEYNAKTSFSNLCNVNSTRPEIIVTFLAILELVKMNKVLAAQEKLFGEIVITCREA